MKSEQLLVLRDRLDDLIGGLRELQQLSEVDAVKMTRRLKRDYHRLYDDLAGISAHQLKSFSREQQLVVRSLEMGKEAFEDFHAKVLPLITRDAKPTAIAIANFTKSSAAFELINKPSTHLSREEFNEVQLLLGGLLGVSVGEEFVRSVKGEMMGRIIAYALSGLCETDVREFEAMDHSRRDAPSRDAFLLDRIQRRCSEMVYAIDRPEADSAPGVWKVACTINENPLSGTNTVQARNRADTCIVNHHKRTIVFGSITSNPSADKKQALSATRMCNALELLTQQRYVGDDPTRPNPYYGYKVEPFYFHTGLFPVEKLIEGERTTGTALFKTLTSEGARLKKADYTALAQLAFFSLFGEGAQGAEVGRTLGKFNVHLCGCDTLKLYQAMRRARRDEDPRAFASVVLRAITDAAGVLARPGLVLSQSESGQTLLRPMFESVLNVVNNHLLNFPVQHERELSETERDCLHDLDTHLRVIEDRLANDGSGLGGGWARSFKLLANALSSKAGLKDFIADGHKATKIAFEWSPERHARLTEKEGLSLTSEGTLERITQRLLADLSAKQVPAVLNQAITMAFTDPGYLGKRPWVEALVNQMVHTIEGGHAVLKIKENATLAGFKQYFSSVRNDSDEGHPGVALVYGLRPFFKKEVWEGRSRMADNPAAVTAVGRLVEELIALDPSVKGYDKLMRSLADLAHPAAETNPPVARRRALRR